MLKDKTLTYISLFSCAGVGCFGFKKAGFECIATNELIERRLNVQKYNNKCRFESGYICDDITTDETKNKIFKEIDRWKELGNDRVDVFTCSSVESCCFVFMELSFPCLELLFLLLETVVPKAWHSCATVLARLCHYVGTTVLPVWHNDFD